MTEIENERAGEVRLLPCPLCDGDAYLIPNGTFLGRVDMASCGSCGCTAHYKKWNRRPSPQAVEPVAWSDPSEMERIEDEVKALLAEPVGYVTAAAMEQMKSAKKGWHYHLFSPQQDLDKDMEPLVPVYASPQLPAQGVGVSDEMARWHQGFADLELRLSAECLKNGFAIEADTHALKAKFHRDSSAFAQSLSQHEDGK